MVKHNNVVPNVHRRKHWQRNVRAYLNQATRKHRRLLARRARAAALSPRPLDRLKPVVHGQTVRYNRKVRLGRGFTLQELKAAGVSRLFAQSVGISVDHRRKNRSQEGLDSNVARLKGYLSKLVLFPRQKEAKKGVKGGLPDSKPEEVKSAKTLEKPQINALPHTGSKTLPESINKQMLVPLYRNEGKRNKPQAQADAKKEK
jgi:large subunit ribosomal protein L13e